MLTNLQSEVMGLIARNRTPDSHLVGGAALNRAGPRLSADLDFFHDPHVDLPASARRDAADLETAGFVVEWQSTFETFHSAVVRKGGEFTRLDWAQDSAWRFFPAQPDLEFGYVLHPIDLATNKMLAAAARRTGRDTIDLLYIEESLLALGPLACAAVAKDPGFSPEALLNWVSRHFARRTEEFSDVTTPEPIVAAEVSRRMHEAIAAGYDFVARMPSEATGCIFLLDHVVVTPDPDLLSRYERREATVGGVWPMVDATDSDLLRRSPELR